MLLTKAVLVKVIQVCKDICEIDFKVFRPKNSLSCLRRLFNHSLIKGREDLRHLQPRVHYQLKALWSTGARL